MVANALTPADVVREAKGTHEQNIGFQGTNASVFNTTPFAKDNIIRGRHFAALPVPEDTLSKETAQNFSNFEPDLINVHKEEAYHKEMLKAGKTTKISNLGKDALDLSIDAFINSMDGDNGVASNASQNNTTLQNETLKNETLKNATTNSNGSI
jgi:hypothetical protein